jgi:hypothetical protein
MLGFLFWDLGIQSYTSVNRSAFCRLFLYTPRPINDRAEDIATSPVFPSHSLYHRGPVDLHPVPVVERFHRAKFFPLALTLCGFEGHVHDLAVDRNLSMRDAPAIVSALPIAQAIFVIVQHEKLRIAPASLGAKATQAHFSFDFFDVLAFAGC